MDEIKLFLSQADNFILWVDAIFFTAFLFVQSLFYLLKDLNNIKSRSIYSIYKEQIAHSGGIDAVDFIDRLYKKSKILVLPAVKNDIHYKSAMFGFFLIAIAAIFNEPLGKFLNINESVFYVIYLPFLGYAISFLVYKFILFKNYFNLQKEYCENDTSVDRVQIVFNSDGS